MFAQMPMTLSSFAKWQDLSSPLKSSCDFWANPEGCRCLGHRTRTGFFFSKSLLLESTKQTLKEISLSPLLTVLRLSPDSATACWVLRQDCLAQSHSL